MNHESNRSQRETISLGTLSFVPEGPWLTAWYKSTGEPPIELGRICFMLAETAGYRDAWMKMIEAAMNVIGERCLKKASMAGTFSFTPVQDTN